MNTKARGEVSEAVVLAHLTKKGVAVSLPFGNKQRYDMILDEEGRLVKAQVKTGWIFRGALVFAVSSKNGFTGKRRAYHGDIDIFLVYSPELEKVYRVPLDVVGKTQMHLRVEEPKPGAAVHDIKWAKDFEM